jgi:Flp pilus assembly protein TadB
MRRGHDQPLLITSAPQSSDDEYDRRRKKYAIMMSLRAIAVLGAALTYHVSLALALGFVIAGAVLPWCAVLVANDRPAKKRQVPLGHVQARPERALPAGDEDDRVVDG